MNTNEAYNGVKEDTTNRANDRESEELKSGVELIALERFRQISEEGFNYSWDDNYKSSELCDAAACYAVAAGEKIRGLCTKPDLDVSLWPWNEQWWKPTDDPLGSLVKAGALIAAQIDRIQRVRLEKGEAGKSSV